ncbi:MAG TPA: pilin, partial [Micromonosporaceae bacterium]|nr:pilin [Micromonosporaceae bacterium]
EVISGITGWIMGILALVATMFLVIGGLRYMAAGGDPAQVEQAKGNFKSALIGYALAVLAPVVLTVLQGILGG